MVCPAAARSGRLACGRRRVRRGGKKRADVVVGGAGVVVAEEVSLEEWCSSTVAESDEREGACAPQKEHRERAREGLCGRRALRRPFQKPKIVAGRRFPRNAPTDLSDVSTRAASKPGALFGGRSQTSTAKSLPSDSSSALLPCPAVYCTAQLLCDANAAAATVAGERERERGAICLSCFYFRRRGRPLNTQESCPAGRDWDPAPPHCFE